MFRGLVTDQPGFPAKRQEAALAAAGIKPIYDDLDDVLRSCRKRNGDMIAVVDFRGLGTTRREIVAAIDKVHDAGYAVIEIVNNWRSDGRHCHKALDAALTARTNSKRGPDGDEAQRFGRKGGLVNGRRRRKLRMPKAMALPYWRDISMTTDEALEKMNSDPNYPGRWTIITAYRNLKKRGGVPGRRATKS